MNGIVGRHRSTPSSVAAVHDGGYHDILKETQTCLFQISDQDPKQMLTCPESRICFQRLADFLST
jgi:hypothetical protein